MSQVWINSLNGWTNLADELDSISTVLKCIHSHLFSFLLAFFVLSHMILFFSLLLSMILLTLFSSHLTSSCLILYFPYLSSPLTVIHPASSCIVSSPLYSPAILSSRSAFNLSIKSSWYFTHLLLHVQTNTSMDPWPSSPSDILVELGFTHASFHSSICLCQSRGYAYFIRGWFDWVWWLPPSICSVYWDAAAEFPNRVLQGSIPNFYSFR